MAGLVQSVAQGTSLWRRPIRYSTDSPVTVQANFQGAINISVYLGYAAYYAGRQYVFRVSCGFSDGQVYEQNFSIAPVINRLSLGVRMYINNFSQSQILLTYVEVEQIEQYNQNYIAYSYATPSNSSVTISAVSENVTVTSPTSLLIEGKTSHTGNNGMLTWNGSTASVVAQIFYSVWGNGTDLIDDSVISTSYYIDDYLAYQYSTFRVSAQVYYNDKQFTSGYSNSVTIRYEYNEPSRPPTSYYCDPSSVILGETSTFRWSGASSGTQGSIRGYNIQRSTDNSTWSSIEQVLTSNTSGSITVEAPQSVDATYYFRIQTLMNSPGIDSNFTNSVTLTIRNIGKLQNPSNVSLDKLVTETDAILSWGASKSNGENILEKYVVSYEDSVYGEEWGEITEYAQLGLVTSTTVLPTEERGSNRRFFIQARGSSGQEYYSDIVQASSDLIKNTIPLAPTNVSNKDVVDRAEINVDITFTEPEDAHGTVDYYELALKYVNGGDWVDNTLIFSTSTSSPIILNISNFQRGVQYQTYVRTVDIFGLYSEWSESHGTFLVNDLQAVPSIAFPIGNRITYNLRPRIGISLGDTESARTFSIALTIGSATYKTNGTGANQFSRVGTTIPKLSNTVFRPSQNLDSGTHIISNVLTNDGISDLYINERPENVNFSINYIQFTDEIEKGVTKVKAIHIHELRDAINTCLRYYGLAQATWSENIIAKQTRVKAIHIQELRNGCETIRTHVNTFHPENTTNYIQRFVWTDQDLTKKVIRAEHVNEIRDAIFEL